jgi:hypothetical protein
MRDIEGTTVSATMRDDIDGSALDRRGRPGEEVVVS